MGVVQFQFGRAGTGKSSEISTEIRHELEQRPLGSRIFWIVPSDNGYATERRLLEQVPATLRVEVISLQRLALRASQALYGNRVSLVNATGKRLFLARVLRGLSKQLPVLGRANPTIGYLDSVIEAFEELTTHQANPDQMEAALQVAATHVESLKDSQDSKRSATLIGKIRDICTVYLAWKNAMMEASRHTADSIMDRLLQDLQQWSELAGATLYFDGFTSLTPLEVAFSAQLAKTSGRSVFSIAIDPMWIESLLKVRPNFCAEEDTLSALLTAVPVAGEVFAPQSLHFTQRLIDALEWLQVPIQMKHRVNMDNPYRFTDAPDLAHLESKLFTSSRVKLPAAEHVVVAAAQNPRVESDGVAREISRLVRECHISFEDVAVLVPNLADYASYLRESFRRHDVQAYIDDFPALAQHPLPRLILSSLQAVVDDASLSSMIRLIKTELCGIGRDDADWLENYLRAHEIMGLETWLDETYWCYEGEKKANEVQPDPTSNDGRANTLRNQFMARFRGLFETLNVQECLPITMAEAIWTVLEAVDAQGTMAAWIVNDDVSQSANDASTHEQAWERVMDLLNDLAEPSHSESLSLSFMFDVIHSDLSSQSLSTIPAGMNQVLVTDFSHSNGWEAEAVFVMGVTDGTFPSRVHSASVLQDDERQAFATLFKSRLAYTATERQLCERLTVYQALTRSRKHLYLTHPLSNKDGKEVRPAMMVKKICNCFQEGTVQQLLWTGMTNLASETKEVEVYSSRSAAFADVVGGFRALIQSGDFASYAAQGVFRWLLEDNNTRQQLAWVYQGYCHDAIASPLSHQTAIALYSTEPKMSAYQLETYAACAYHHFAKYGLRLQVAEKTDMSAAQRGSLIHDALQQFVQIHSEDIEAWRNLSAQAAKNSMAEVFQALLGAPEAISWLRKESRHHQAQEALRVLKEAAVVLTEHARYGLFESKAMELSFGDYEGCDLPSYTIAVSAGVQVHLRGRLDRLDGVKQGNRHAFRIIDYKSSELDIDLSKLYYGLRLQLPLYALVVQHHSELIFGQPSQAVGLLYIPIRQKSALKNAPDATETALTGIRRGMQAKGLMMNDRDVVTWMDQRLSDSGDSDLFRKVYRKDGQAMQYAPVVNPEDWKRLLDVTLLNVRRAATKILDGDIAARPYHSGSTENACQFCDYSSLCHFDAKVNASSFRRLPALSKQDALTAMGTKLVEQEETEYAD